MTDEDRLRLKGEFRDLIKAACEQAAKAERANKRLEPIEARFRKLAKARDAEEMAFSRLWSEICTLTWAHYAGGPVKTAAKKESAAAEGTSTGSE